MNFDLTEEQAMLKQSLERLLEARYDFEARRRIASEPTGWSRETWRELADLGLLAAPFDETDGGLGFGPFETMLIGETLGSRLVAEPYLPSVVLAAAALKHADNRALISQLAPKIGAGEAIIAVGFSDLVKPTPQGGGGLYGPVTIPFGDSADWLLIVAWHGVFLVDAKAEGMSVRGHRTFDGLRSAEVFLHGARVGPDGVLAVEDAADALAEHLRQHAIAYLAAEAVGLMSMALDATIEHLKTRKQFGQTLGKFQALQHRCAEMAVALEQARSIAIYAAAALSEPDAEERRRAFAAVKSVIGTAGRFVGNNAVQLHGGVGVTEEHRVGWALRRLTMIDMSFGDSDTHNAELARLGGFVGAV
jgi:alkylation response protein AidB-like acyl-CoA dehydrogenase